MAVVAEADDADLQVARHHAQQLAAVGHRAISVPTDVCFTDRGLVSVRPWFDTLMADGARAAGLSGRQCVALVVDLADALDAIHRKGLRHGAVKASNVAIAADGTARLIDPAAGIGSSSDDTIALGLLAVEWISELAAAPVADFALDRCAAAADERLTAAELRDDLAPLLQSTDREVEPEDVVATNLPRSNRAKGIALAVVVLGVSASVAAWAAAADRPARSPEIVAAPDECDGSPPSETAAGAEILMADVSGRGCSVAVTWWAARAEAEILAGSTVGRFRLGERGDRLVLGDWDGDRDAEPALYRPTTGEVFLWSSWPVDGAPAPSTARLDSGVLGGEPIVIVDGDRHAVDVVAGTPS